MKEKVLMIKTHKDSTTEEFKPLRLIQSLVYLYYAPPPEVSTDRRTNMFV